jgi:hypothetical protein
VKLDAHAVHPEQSGAFEASRGHGDRTLRASIALQKQAEMDQNESTGPRKNA